MAGFNTITGDEAIMTADNCSFDGTDRGGKMTTNGQLWIGSTASNRAPNAGHVRLGSITSPDSSVTIGYSSPNITITNGLANGRFPITPYVVGPVGQAGYQTIQAGINAAAAAGGGLVYVQKGTYTENLVFPTVGTIGVTGDSEQATIIVGVHTPPTSGFLNIDRVTLSSPTNIFLSSAVGTTSIIVEDCTINATSGYAFNLLNWSGSIGLFNIASIGANDGGINNTGGSPIFAFSVSMGSGGSNVMTLSGALLITTSEFAAPMTLATGTTGTFDYCSFTNTVTCANNSTVTFSYTKFNTGATPALTMSSSAAVNLFHAIINTSNNPSISGAGAGTLTYSDLVFQNNAAFAGTLTLAKKSWQPYSVALAATDGTKVGNCNFNSAQFTVDANGFVSTTGIASNAFNQVKNQVFAATGTYTPTTGMKYCQIICIGGGAAGGGAPTTTVSNTSCGSGGGAGEYAVGIFTAATIGASQAVTIGAGGTGVSGAAGNNGGTTSVGALITANGGTGGLASTSASLIVTAVGQAGGTGGTGGDYRCDGANGTFGVSAFGVAGSTIQGHGGDGGNSYLGAGGRGALSAGNGGGGHLYGSGGGGSLTFASAATTGGSGDPGIVIVTEYISV
jgi:hypothetical protein